MKQNLQDYIKIYKNVISSEICDSTLSFLKQAEWTKHHFYYPRENIYKTDEKEAEVFTENTPNEKYIMDQIYTVLEKYILQDINFPWMNGWEGFSSLKYNRYNTGQYMKEHCDNIRDVLQDSVSKGVPILTVIGLLNDDFKGGEFYCADKEIKLQKGDVIVFPSNFLFPHKVETVNEGQRYSFVSWSW